MKTQTMAFDIVIVGAGPAGLASAIHLAQLNRQKSTPLSICVVDKGVEIGAHIISGAVMDPAGLNALIPEWRSLGAPVNVKVNSDTLYYLSKRTKIKLPTPKLLKNKNNYIISLSELCRWLGHYAENLGVNIFPGFAVSDLIYNAGDDAVIGVQTGDFGLDKTGNPTNQFQAGIRLLAKQTIIAEGCRGSISQKVIQKFSLSSKSDPQSYALGVKEVWKVQPKHHCEGQVIHTLGWPLDRKTYGGGFVYHFRDNMVSLGIIIGLDYRNPYLNPFKELQRLKHHTLIKSTLAGGECLSYGARVLNEGGLQSLPKLAFPGGLLVGCSAGMLNVGKLKGIHNAIHSGMLAAEAITEAPELAEKKLHHYQKKFNQSSIYRELHRARNLRPAFQYGLWFGLSNAFIDQYLFHGKAPWDMHHKVKTLKPSNCVKKIHYPKPDGTLSFTITDQVFLSATRHREGQPCHLKLLTPSLAVAHNLKNYAGPESRYCPAGVYEFIETAGRTKLQINSANCIHCKACDIKDPKQNIVWQVPEGGSGPAYRYL